MNTATLTIDPASARPESDPARLTLPLTTVPGVAAEGRYTVIQRHLMGEFEQDYVIWRGDDYPEAQRQALGNARGMAYPTRSVTPVWGNGVRLDLWRVELKPRGIVLGGDNSTKVYGYVWIEGPLHPAHTDNSYCLECQPKEGAV